MHRDDSVIQVTEHLQVVFHIFRDAPTYISALNAVEA